MQNEVLVAILGMAGTIIGSGLGIYATARTTNFRLDSLEKKVELHNNVIERLYIAEGKITELQHDVRDLKVK